MVESKGAQGEPRLDVTALRAMARLVDVRGRTCCPTACTSAASWVAADVMLTDVRMVLATRRCRACGTNYTAAVQRRSLSARPRV